MDKAKILTIQSLWYWNAAAEFRGAVAGGDIETARLALEEISAIVMHAPQSALRERAREMLVRVAGDRGAPAILRQVAQQELEMNGMLFAGV